jgi:hypothetical protein
MGSRHVRIISKGEHVFKRWGRSGADLGSYGTIPEVSRFVFFFEVPDCEKYKEPKLESYKQVYRYIRANRSSLRELLVASIYIYTYIHIYTCVP